MTKRIKRGAVDRYIKKNPLAPASLVAKEVGCHASTVYLARKRLGLPTTMKEQNVQLFDAVSKKPVDKTPLIVNDFLHEEVHSLQKRLDFSSTVNKALGAAVVVLAIVGTMPFVLPYFK